MPVPSRWCSTSPASWPKNSALSMQVQLAVELVVLALDERQEGLEVPVADVGDVEADAARCTTSVEPLARPVRAHPLAERPRGIRRGLNRAAPQRARDQVEQERQREDRRQPQVRRADEAVGVDQPVSEGRSRRCTARTPMPTAMETIRIWARRYTPVSLGAALPERDPAGERAPAGCASTDSRTPSPGAERAGRAARPRRASPSPSRRRPAGPGRASSATVTHLAATGRPSGSTAQGRAAYGDRRRGRPARPAASSARGGVAVEHPGVAEEERGLGVGRRAPDVGDRARLDDPPGPHHGQVVGDGERLLVVVGDHHRRGARLDAGSRAGRRPAAARSPASSALERLVEQQQPRRRRPGRGPARPAAARRRTGWPGSRSA